MSISYVKQLIDNIIMHEYKNIRKVTKITIYGNLVRYYQLYIDDSKLNKVYYLVREDSDDNYYYLKSLLNDNVKVRVHRLDGNSICFSKYGNHNAYNYMFYESYKKNKRQFKTITNKIASMNLTNEINA